MCFEIYKRDILRRKDKSREGKVDGGIMPLVDQINRNDSFVTTSSCAGRIVVLKQSGDKKNGCEWAFKSHGISDYREVERETARFFNDSDDDNTIYWFRFEGSILHVACKDVREGLFLVSLARQSGYMRSGLQSDRKAVMAELIACESISAPIAIKNRLVADSCYIRLLTMIANEKLKKNKEKIGRLLLSLREINNRSDHQN